MSYRIRTAKSVLLLCLLIMIMTTSAVYAATTLTTDQKIQRCIEDVGDFGYTSVDIMNPGDSATYSLVWQCNGGVEAHVTINSADDYCRELYGAHSGLKSVTRWWNPWTIVDWACY